MGGMSVEYQFCPLCGSDGTDRKYHENDTITYKCRRCGKFGLTGSAEAIVRAKQREDQTIANVSGWIWEHQGVSLDEHDLDGLWALRTPPVVERAMKLLQELARRRPTVGAMFDFDFTDYPSIDPTWLAATWSASMDEVEYLVLTYLRDAAGALAGTPADSADGAVLLDGHITPRGYELLEQMREANPESPIGFCAMWFADDVKLLWTEAVEPAIRRAGYDPKRIDQHEHVNKIDDEIVAMIRRSRFVVADFTGQRGGVYFEAGYALGLGLRVIWLCRDDEKKDVHFDTRQYNFLFWKPGEYADLAARLQNRIEATLGRGPIR
jgi:hypothetical protein